MKTYEVNNQKFILDKLKLGQVRQLIESIGDVDIDLDAPPIAITLALSDRLPAALAVVLCPEGVKPQDKDLTAIAQTMANMDVDMAVEVIADFLELNRASGIEKQIKRMTGMFMTNQQPPLTNTPAGSAKETPAN